MSEPAIGREIGSYQIVGLLGRGGMGEVYRAQHPYIGKQVAVKLLKAELSEQSDIVKRFFQEARAVNDIHHENVIDVLDFGRTNDGEYFIIMELLEGFTLSQVLKNDAPFPLKRLGHMALQICSALAAAHEKSIIHRDLKSDNIFLVTRAGQKDFIKVLDFGIAKLLDGSASTNTTTGMVMGTPLYMAPEQALGRPLDAQTDVYALGVILYQMATGTVPFFDNNPVALATMHVTKPPPKPSERYANIDPKLEKLILKCLAKEKADRYLSMAAVAQDLGAVCALDVGPYFGREPADPSAVLVGETVETPGTPNAPSQAAQSTTSLVPPQKSARLRWAAGAVVVLSLGGFAALQLPTSTKPSLAPVIQPPTVITAPASIPVKSPPSQPLAATIPSSVPVNTVPEKPTKSTKPTKLTPKPEPPKPEPPKPEPPKPEPPKPEPPKVGPVKDKTISF